jgi:hypothetical protein
VVSLVAAASSSLLGLSPAEARACSPSWPVPEGSSVSKLTDSTPPVIVDVTVGDLTRGKYDPMNSCSDIGRLWLDVVATDDQTPFEKLRYRVQDLTAEEPSFYFDDPVPYFYLTWAERDDSEPLEFRLRIFVLDQAGNQSEPFDITVQDGVDEGCSIAARLPRTAPPVWGVLLVALAGWVRRRRSG